MPGVVTLRIDGKPYRVRWNGGNPPTPADIADMERGIRSQVLSPPSPSDFTPSSVQAKERGAVTAPAPAPTPAPRPNPAPKVPQRVVPKVVHADPVAKKVGDASASPTLEQYAKKKPYQPQAPTPAATYAKKQYRKAFTPEMEAKARPTRKVDPAEVINALPFHPADLVLALRGGSKVVQGEDGILTIQRAQKMLRAAMGDNATDLIKLASQATKVKGVRRYDRQTDETGDTLVDGEDLELGGSTPITRAERLTPMQARMAAAVSPGGNVNKGSDLSTAMMAPSAQISLLPTLIQMAAAGALTGKPETAFDPSIAQHPASVAGQLGFDLGKYLIPGFGNAMFGADIAGLAGNVIGEGGFTRQTASEAAMMAAFPFLAKGVKAGIGGIKRARLEAKQPPDVNFTPPGVDDFQRRMAALEELATNGATEGERQAARMGIERLRGKPSKYTKGTPTVFGVPIEEAAPPARPAPQPSPAPAARAEAPGATVLPEASGGKPAPPERIFGVDVQPFTPGVKTPAPGGSLRPAVQKPAKTETATPVVSKTDAKEVMPTEPSANADRPVVAKGESATPPANPATAKPAPPASPANVPTKIADEIRPAIGLSSRGSKVPWQGVRVVNPLTKQPENFDSEEQMAQYDGIQQKYRQEFKALRARAAAGENVEREVMAADMRRKKDTAAFWKQKGTPDEPQELSELDARFQDVATKEPGLADVARQALAKKEETASKLDVPTKTQVSEIRAVAQRIADREEGASLAKAFTRHDADMEAYGRALTKLRKLESGIPKGKKRELHAAEIVVARGKVEEKMAAAKQSARVVMVEHGELKAKHPQFADLSKEVGRSRQALLNEASASPEKVDPFDDAYDPKLVREIMSEAGIEGDDVKAGIKALERAEEQAAMRKAQSAPLSPEARKVLESVTPTGKRIARPLDYTGDDADRIYVRVYNRKGKWVIDNMTNEPMMPWGAITEPTVRSMFQEWLATAPINDYGIIRLDAVRRHRAQKLEGRPKGTRRVSEFLDMNAGGEGGNNLKEVFPSSVFRQFVKENQRAIAAAYGHGNEVWEPRGKYGDQDSLFDDFETGGQGGLFGTEDLPDRQVVPSTKASAKPAPSGPYGDLFGGAVDAGDQKSLISRPPARPAPGARATEMILGVETEVRPGTDEPFAFKSTKKQITAYDENGYPAASEIIHAGTREEYQKLIRALPIRPKEQPAAVGNPADQARVQRNGPAVEAIKRFLMPGGRTVYVRTQYRITPIKNPDSIRMLSSGDVQFVDGKKWLNLVESQVMDLAGQAGYRMARPWEESAKIEKEQSSGSTQKPTEQAGATDRAGRQPERESGSPVPERSGGSSQAADDRIVTARQESTQEGNLSLIPDDLREHLTPHQAQGAALMIDAMSRPTATFLNADGTGVGKTRQILTAAEVFAREGKRVIIVAPNEVLGKPFETKPHKVTGSYAKDAEAMGVKFRLIIDAATEPNIKDGEIGVTTYHRLSGVTINENTVLIWDEAHNLKNYFPYEKGGRSAKTSVRGITGITMTRNAGGVIFASATPADTPKAIQYLNARGALAAVLPDVGFTTAPWSDPGKQILDFLGYEERVKILKRGGEEIKWTLTLKAEEARARMDTLLTNLTENGQMVKREISLNGTTVSIDQIELPEDVHQTLALIEGELSQTGKDEKGNELVPASRAVILGHQRRVQEPYKIMRVVEKTKAALDNGEQVVIFAARVNDSNVDQRSILGFDTDGSPIFDRKTIVATEGTMRKLHSALVEAGIPASEIAEIHGGVPATAADEAARFQSGKAKVVIATIESGGTGINLDDATGGAPRRMIVMTPPFSALTNMQALGRIWRLSTKSFANFEYIFGNTEIDRWNAALLARKMGDLGAVVQGEIKQISNAIDPDYATVDEVLDAIKGESGEAAPVRAPKSDYRIVKSKHTREGYDIWIVQATKFMDRADFDAERSRARELGGYYSSFGATKGFLFKDAESAELFAGTATSGDVELTAPVPQQMADSQFEPGHKAAYRALGQQSYEPITVVAHDRATDQYWVRFADGRMEQISPAYIEDVARLAKVRRESGISDEPVDVLEERVKKAKIEGYFPTPPALAERMAEMADFEPGMTMLEPSAGRGNLAKAALARGAKVSVAEINADLRGILKQRGFELVGSDAMEIDGQFDRILMNPPFEQRQDAIHVMNAFNKNLAPGGRLVAIMGEGPFFASDKASITFRAWLEHVGGISEKLPEGTFKESDIPTGVNVRLVVVDKPVAAKTAQPSGNSGQVKKDLDPQALAVKAYIAAKQSGKGMKAAHTAAFEAVRKTGAGVTESFDLASKVQDALEDAPAAADAPVRAALVNAAKSDKAAKLDAKTKWATDKGIAKGGKIIVTRDLGYLRPGSYEVTAVSKSAIYVGTYRVESYDVVKGLQDGTVRLPDTPKDTLFEHRETPTVPTAQRSVTPEKSEPGLTREITPSERATQEAMASYKGRFIVAKAGSQMEVDRAVRFGAMDLGELRVAMPNVAWGRGKLRAMEFDRLASIEFTGDWLNKHTDAKKILAKAMQREKRSTLKGDGKEKAQDSAQTAADRNAPGAIRGQEGAGQGAAAADRPPGELQGRPSAQVIRGEFPAGPVPASSFLVALAPSQKAHDTAVAKGAVSLGSLKVAVPDVAYGRGLIRGMQVDQSATDAFNADRPTLPRQSYTRGGNMDQAVLFDPKAPYDHDAGLAKMRTYDGKFVVARARMDSIKDAALANQGENLGAGMIAFPNTLDGRSAVRQLFMEFDRKASDEYNRRFAAPVEDVGGGLFGGDDAAPGKAPIGSKEEEFGQDTLFERRKQYGAFLPRMKKIPKAKVAKGDLEMAARVALALYRGGKTTLREFRKVVPAQIGQWASGQAEILFRTAQRANLDEPGNLLAGEHLRTAVRPRRDKTVVEWAIENVFTTGARAERARGWLEQAWGLQKGSLVGSKMDIAAAISRMARVSGKAESYVLRGFTDEEGNRITLGLPEIEAILEKGGVDYEDHQIFRRAMAENFISHRPGNIAISPERVVANEMAMAEFEAKYREKWSVVQDAAIEYKRFGDAYLELWEKYGLKPVGWAQGIRENYPGEVYWPLFEALSAEDLAMMDVMPGSRGTGELDVKRVKGGKPYMDGDAARARNVEKLVRAGEMSKAFTPFLEEASKHPLLSQWLVKDITEEVEMRKAFEKAKAQGPSAQEMNALDGDLEAQRELDEMMAQMAGEVDLAKDAIVVTYAEGRKKYWKVDPYLWAATKGAAPEQFNGFMQVLRFFGNLNRGLTTKYNPLFALVFNPAIDVASAVTQHGMNPARFVQGALHAARGESSPLYRRAVENNVFFNSRGMRDFLEQRWIFDEGDKRARVRILGDRFLRLRGVEFVNRASQTMEEATRLGFFAQREKAYLGQGLPAEEAARRASDDSANLMNFGEAGVVGRTLSRWGVPFANVTTQVIMSGARGYRRNPLKFLLRMVALITIPKLIEYALYRDDDEYKRMPNYAKDGTLMFKRGPGDWLAIRIPQELGTVFAGIPRRALEAQAGTKTGKEALGEQAAELLDMLIPPMLPTPLAAAIQQGEYHRSGQTYDLRFGVSRRTDFDNPAYGQAKQQASTLLGSLGKLGVEYTGYFTGLEEKPPSPLQRFAPRPGRPTISVEGPSRGEWLELRNPNSHLRKKKTETEAAFAKRAKQESEKARRVLDAKRKLGSWGRKTDAQKRKALADAGVKGIRAAE